VVHRWIGPLQDCSFARTSKALTRLNELFKNRETKKRMGNVENKPDKSEDKLVHFIKRNEKTTLQKHI
jgi:23S rRNA pseudouridine1911/1915/1917 synthase